MITLSLYKKHVKGGATYIHPGTRARVIVSRKMFAGDAPENVTFDGANIAEPTEKDLKKAESMKNRAERVAKNSTNLAERVAKAKAKADKLAAQLAAQEAAPAPAATDQPTA
jgi:hypothetical protein